MEFFAPIIILSIACILSVIITRLVLKNKAGTVAIKLDIAEKEKEELHGRLAAANERIKELEKKNDLLSFEQGAVQEKLAFINEAKEKLTDAFSSASAEVLERSTKAFIELAEQNFGKHREGAKGDLEKRQQAISELIRPIKESLDKFDINVKEIEKVRHGAYESLTHQVKELHGANKDLKYETSTLVTALKGDINTKGQWGEFKLRRVVEVAGMQEYCHDFELQVSVEDGKSRPDMVVKLPGNRNIVIDAKAPVKAYLEALDADDENVQKEKLSNVAGEIRKRIDDLSKKNYSEKIEKKLGQTVDFVVMFLPMESLFRVALEHDKDLIEYGADKKIILATPATLIALLRVVAYGWREEKLAENARDISNLGKELYKRIASMLKNHMGDLEKHLGKSVDAYNSMVGSLKRNVMPQLRKFEEYGATPDGVALAEPNDIEQTPNELQIPEMTEAKKDKKQGEPK